MHRSIPQEKSPSAGKKGTPSFLDDDFLLPNETARRLYHEYAADMPIIDYHCHLPPAEIEGNRQFENLTAIWLHGDHYKWRAMRTLGVEEKFITGDASDEEKFKQWAAIVPYTLRNPLYHWTHMELKNPFGITELLHEGNAAAIYAEAGRQLSEPGFSTRGLLQHFRVETVCTTDDPCDDLRHHRALHQRPFGTQVLPAFRPDKVFQLGGGEAYRQYISRLADAAGTPIKDLDSLLEALGRRVDYFHAQGGRLADHGLTHIPLFDADIRPGLDAAFRAVLQGQDGVDPATQDSFTGYLLWELCRLYHDRDWVQQFHLGALRNTNSGKLKAYGPDTGFDSIGDYRQAEGLAALFDKLDREGRLAKTILYNLNPADNELFATMTGNFNEGPARGKMQYGSAWWFLDQLDGMEKQLNALSNMGILSCFVGMLTDSRSFLSYSRHEYFRRLLCRIFGQDVQAGLLPADLPWLGKIVQDICYNNAKQYFGWQHTAAAS